jgi:hypothetical protein
MISAPAARRRNHSMLAINTAKALEETIFVAL